jgi:class 3 adenylate cyclase/predicted ATPase
LVGGEAKTPRTFRDKNGHSLLQEDKSMRCPGCSTENPDGAKFCIACGAALKSRCLKCGAESLPEAKFCAQCGASLQTTGAPVAAATALASTLADSGFATSEVPEGERKTVTALFADIKGSMELMEELDPEEARAIVDPALKLMMDAAHRYDGYIVQSTGDGIFAIFGAPVVHEDHPQRAVHAALRMQGDLKRYADQLRERGQPPLSVRVGINGGEVVVRSIRIGDAHTEYTPIGHSMSMASRLQTLAAPGSVVIGESVQKFVEGYFQLKALGASKIKGVSEPVKIYEVTGLGPLRTRLQRSAGRGLTKFVGRQREMKTLKHAAEQAQGGHGQIVAAMAEPGVGKSRLFFEFKATSQSGWMVLETFSVSHGKASPYLPVIDLLRNYFDISASDDERKRREKVTGRALALDRNLEDALPYLFSLLGIVEGEDSLAQMDGQIKKRRTLEAIKRILLRESLNQPLMVIFEDLHWIDEQTQGLLNLIADSIGTAKLLLLVNYRPEYSHEWSSKTYYTQLRLDPLGRESAQEMLSALLGDGKDLIPLKRLIIERTEGTPFFMEEIVQSLFEDGVLRRNGTVKLAKSMNAVKVPATVQAVLAARIDRLSVEEKELLQTLAVLGREFRLELVHLVTLKPSDESERMLARLQAGEFIYEQLATGDVEYVFKHALTQEVAYNALLIERRKLLHERAGLALESIFAEQMEDHLDELAHHYSRSDNVSKAVEYLGRAGQQAMQRSAYADAISSFNTAIDLSLRLPVSPERTQRELFLRLAVGPALSSVKGWAAPEAERTYTRARELCERLGDPPEIFPALVGLWIVHLLRGEIGTARELAERLLRRAQSADDPVLLQYAQLALGETSFFKGDLLHAREHLEVAISLHYDRERYQAFTFRYLGIDAVPLCLLYAAWTLWNLGYPDQALMRGKEALAFAHGLSHPFSLAFTEGWFGVLHQYRREAYAAQETAEDAIALAAERGFTDLLSRATSIRGWAISEQGRHEEGIAQIREGLAAYRATGSEILRPYFLTLLAEACMATGRLDDGLDALTEALAAADEHGNRHHDSEIHRLKGEVLLRQNNAQEAQKSFEHAIEVARSQSAKSFELRATMSLARLLASQGHRDEARAMLAEIYNWFTEGFDTADLKEANTLLDELSN